MSGRFIALIRGINVGGKNIVPMAALRARFVEHGFTDIETYIQSGNVVFSSTETDPRALGARVSAILARHFSVETPVLVVSNATLARVVDEAPKGFGETPDTHRFDVLFVIPPVTPREVRAAITLKEGVDEAHVGSAALYFTRLIARATASHLTRITQSGVYSALTIRNWNTTRALDDMARGAGTPSSTKEAAKKTAKKKTAKTTAAGAAASAKKTAAGAAASAKKKTAKKTAAGAAASAKK